MSDLIDVLEGRIPTGNVPSWELVFHLWSKASGKKFIEGREFEALSSAEKNKALNLNAEIIAEVSEKYNFDAVTIPGGFWEVAPGEPAYYWLPDEYIFEQIKLIKKNINNNIILTGTANSIMAIPESNDYVNFACKLFDDPDGVEEMAKAKYVTGLELAKKYADVGIKMIVSASDIADNMGPFFKPDQFERFILPFIQNWTKEVKSLGCLPVLHTDGNVSMYLDELSDSGLLAIQAIDPVAGMNIKETKEKINGRMAVCGNVDCGILLTGKPEDVYNETKKILVDCKDGGGLIIGASNAVQQEVPIENYEALVKAKLDFGKY